MKNLITKRLFQSGLVFFLVVSLISCNDAIDINPEGSLISDVTFETVSDLQLGLNGAYASYSPENDIYFNSVFTDNCKPGVDNGGQGINLYNWALDPATGASSNLWTSYYRLINNANRIIEAASKITPTASEQIDYNNIVGQAYALRALAHFQLLQYFTTDYQDGSALSAIISDHVPAINEQFNRNTNAEVYAFIESDLQDAANLISNSFSNPEYITQDFITGLKARVSLLKGDTASLNTAIANAQTLIDNYSLANRTQYTNMFYDTDNTEVIFKMRRINIFIGGLWYFTNSAGPFFEASNSLHNSLDMTDIRRSVLINFNGNNGGPSDPAMNYILINKYPGNSTAFLSDFKAMRVSEMYLIKAEAQAQNNDLTGAATTLKQLRDARFLTPTALDTYGNINDALTAVINERRIELAYEGQRYLDLKRLGGQLNMGISRDAIDCAGGGNCFLAPSDFKFTLPIAQVEINANASIVQNPGYTN